MIQIILASDWFFADYIGGGKVERAKIRVEHIIREDYMVSHSLNTMSIIPLPSNTY